MVDVEYRVTHYPEGDTRGCGPNCDWIRPTSSEHAATLRFLGSEAALRIQVPPQVPGLAGTPLDREHNGGCYGRSGPFSPMPVRLR